jgi:hypothetical protein
MQDVDPDAIPTQDEVDTLREAGEEAPDQELADAVTGLADYAEQLVGLDAEDPEDADDIIAAAETLDEDTVSGVGALDEFTTDECDYEVPIFAQFVSGGEADDDSGDDDEPEVDIDTGDLRTALEENAPDIESQITSIVSVNDAFTIGADGLTDPDEAVDICDAVSDEIAGLGGEGLEIEVGDTEGTILATGEAGSDCEAA